MAPALFQKKSKLSLREKPITVIINEDGYGYPKHTRSMSTTSTASTASSTTSHGHKLHTFDPLSLHPPLSLNTSPVIDEEYDEERRQSAEQAQALQEQQASSSFDDLDSPLDYYFNSDDRRRTYVYDQQAQWPLKDWQSVPSGAKGASSDEEDMSRRAMLRTTSSSSTTSQRRPQKQFTGPLDEFVRRGEWKRRGIVFGMEAEAVDNESRHFEVNPFEFSQ